MYVGFRVQNSGIGLEDIGCFWLYVISRFRQFRAWGLSSGGTTNTPNQPRLHRGLAGSVECKGLNN